MESAGYQTFLELSGWNTFFTGANTLIPDIIQAIKQQNADLLALSMTIPWCVIKAEKLITKFEIQRKLRILKSLSMVMYSNWIHSSGSELVQMVLLRMLNKR